jgi:hypothetical protein
MIIHDCEQGSERWHRLRLGIPTASCFSKIVTPGGKLSKQSEGYMHRLLAEWLYGAPLEDPESTYRSEWMQRGNDLEESAVQAYEFQTGYTTEKVGFVTDDEGNLGCSPDRLIGETGLLEIKVPAWATHVGYMLTGSIEQDYTPQLQGQLLLTGRKWVDVTSYCPPFPLVIIRVTRDGPYQTALAEALSGFVRNMLDARERLITKYGDIRPPAVVEVPFDPLGVSDQDLKDMGIFQEASHD